MAINVVLEDPQLTVLGPPAQVTLNVNSGEKGSRGSRIFTGTGNPNNSGLLTDKVLEDLFIRTDFGNDYGAIYQYSSLPGGPEWVKVLNFQPISYSKRHNLFFTSGSVSASVVVTDFYEDVPISISASNFVTQVSIENNMPVAFSHTKTYITSSKTLILNIYGSGLSASSWLSLSGSVNVNIGINVS
jgi:hypothetical protein